jgi:Icc-related predicted phosphoesterase
MGAARLPDWEVLNRWKDSTMPCVRIAAAGDVHADERTRPRVEEAFARIEGEADVVLLAGDLTTHGRPEEAEVLADACRSVSIPIYAVLGNHDWHDNRVDEVTKVFEDAGIVVLERASATCEVNGTRLGIAATKGFVGGFPGSTLPDFGEPLLRQVYAETGRDVEGLERALEEIEDCPLRVVLLHYSPTMSTLRGEPETIWTFLGTNRLDGPIQKHKPHLVLHGHAHEGTFAGAIGAVPVYNVAVHVTGRDFFVFELDSEAPDGSGRKLEAPSL